MYKKSIDLYSIDLCFSALERVENESDLKKVFYASNQILVDVAFSSYDSNIGYNKTKCLESIIEKDYEAFLAHYCLYIKESMVYNSSIEYRIGKKILKLLKIKK